ncbi:Uncharacterised protein [Vibrio cholerae]|nr:Uncharacterised protein [Vibrio cholerae]
MSSMNSFRSGPKSALSVYGGLAVARSYSVVNSSKNVIASRVFPLKKVLRSVRAYCSTAANKFAKKFSANSWCSA